MPKQDKSKYDMAWNEPGGSGGNGDKDPWNNNRGKRGDQGPPDLDEVFKNLQDKFGSLFGGKGGGKRGGKSGGSGFSAFGIGLVVAILFTFWMATGFYKIEEAERGIVLRFGAHVDTVQTGLHWHFPVPIEHVEKVDVTRIHTLPIDSTMLTEDENIVDIIGTVQYQIIDAEAFLFNVRRASISLVQITESSLRQSIGRSKMDHVITDGRAQIAIEVEDIIQGIVNTYQAGITIFDVNIQEAKPPEEVKDAFDDVTRAREDEVRFLNEAEAYRNEVIPKARGAAARVLEEAEAYKSAVVAQAEGEGERFKQLLAEYKKAPQITRQRLYIDMKEAVFNNSTKIMIDVDEGNNLMLLPLDKLMGRQAVMNDATKQQRTADDILNDIRQRGEEQSRQQARLNDLRSRGVR